ncbi:hypothetical protein QE152_g22315 [Popillia japonica]|uniref:Uncharacterized protein n=1 Tax=Popillia japonica TaxID=7064 RepID=A0AAW1KMG7_POPJA
MATAQTYFSTSDFPTPARRQTRRRVTKTHPKFHWEQATAPTQGSIINQRLTARRQLILVQKISIYFTDIYSGNFPLDSWLGRESERGLSFLVGRVVGRCSWEPVLAVTERMRASPQPALPTRDEPATHHLPLEE